MTIQGLGAWAASSEGRSQPRWRAGQPACPRLPQDGALGGQPAAGEATRRGGAVCLLRRCRLTAEFLKNHVEL